jgi:hypothetical protein
MKIIRIALHYWFALISILSFLIGWGMLAHSLKPIQPAQTGSSSSISLPALPPIQAFGTGDGSGNGLNFSAPSNSSTTFSPRLRTGGS